MNLIVSLAAAFSILAGVIHVFVAPHHWEHWWGYGALFVLVGVAQALFGFALLWWPKRFPPFPRRVILVLGIVANLAIIAFYVLTRTVGIPFGPEAGTVEDVGAVDLVSKVVETSSLWYSRLSGWPGEGSDERSSPSADLRLTSLQALAVPYLKR